MVEIDDEYEGDSQYSKRLGTCLRMNVANVKILAQHLKAKNISVDYQEHPWRTVAKFFDPDGNLCSFKDSKKFETQITDYKIEEMRSKSTSKKYKWGDNCDSWISCNSEILSVKIESMFAGSGEQIHLHSTKSQFSLHNEY